MLVYLIAVSPSRARILSNGRPHLLTEVESVGAPDGARRAVRLGEADRASRFAGDLAAYLDRLGTREDPARLILAAPDPLLGRLDDCLRDSCTCAVVARLQQDLGEVSLRRIASLAREAILRARQPVPELKPLRPRRDGPARRSPAPGSLRERSSRPDGAYLPVREHASAVRGSPA